MTRYLQAAVVATSLLVASCLFVSSFDRYDPDAPDLLAGDAGTVQVPSDADGPFTARVEAPAVIDGPTPGTVVVRVERTAPVPLRLSVTLPAGIVVSPSNVVLEPSTSSVSFRVDVSTGPRGAVSGVVRAERIDGTAAQTADLSFRTTGPGDLDTTFGDGGVLVVPTAGGASEGTVHALALDEAGNAIVAGHDVFPTVARYLRVTPQGTLDSTFGDEGVVLDPTELAPNALVPRNDGIWASGFVPAPPGRIDVVLARYSTTGAKLGSTSLMNVDADPGSALLLPTTDGALVFAHDNSHDDYPFDVFKESVVRHVDGAGVPVGSATRNAIPVHRYTRLGQFARGLGDWPGDAAFIGGRFLHAIPQRGLFDEDRPVPSVVAGYVASGAGRGSLDPTFGAGGIATETGVPATEQRVAFGLAGRADGSFLTVGASTVDSNPFTADSNRMLVRSFSASGVHDPGFPNPLQSCQGILFGAVLDGVGRLLAVGYFGTVKLSPQVRALAVVRLRADGTVDPTFGVSATANAGCTAHPGVAGGGFGGLAFAQARRVLIDASGRLIVAGLGQRRAADGTTSQVWFVARYRG